MQGELSLDMVEGCVRFQRIDTFVGLVNDQNIPCHILDLLQLIELPSKVDGTLQILKA